MPLSDLNEDEICIVAECLKAASHGPFFEDNEFHTLFGVTREEAQFVSDRFPNVDEHDDEATGSDDSWLVINNTLVNLIGYPHGKQSIWDQHISVPKTQVEEIYKKWK